MTSAHVISGRSSDAARIALPTVLSIGADRPQGDDRHLLVGLARFPLQSLLSDLLARWMAQRLGSSFAAARPNPDYELAAEACVDKLSNGLAERDLFVAMIATGTETPGPEQRREIEVLRTAARKDSLLHWIAHGSASACFNPADGCALVRFDTIPGAIALTLPPVGVECGLASFVSMSADYGFARAHCTPKRVIELFAPSAMSSRRGSSAHV